MDSSIKDNPLKIALAGAALPVIVITGSVACQELMARRGRKRLRPPGKMISVGSHRLHLFVKDSPDMKQAIPEAPTVILEGGLASPYVQWFWVMQEVARFARVVAYDRAGTGWSEVGPKPRDAKQITGELRTALGNAEIGGPYVMVGHSIGGLLAKVFADRYPEDTAGLVLVDSSHPEELERSIRQRNGLPQLEQALKRASRRSLFDVLGDGVLAAAVPGLPQKEADEMKSLLSSHKSWQEILAEFEAWKTSINAEARASKVPAALPMAVLTASRTILRDPEHEELQKDLAGLSSNSTWQSVEGATHESIVWERKHALTVADEIRAVTEAIRTEGALKVEKISGGSSRPSSRQNIR